MNDETAIRLRPPLTEEGARKLKAGDKVLISGTIFTGRDQVHRLLFERKPEDLKDALKGAILYHCGPIVRLDKVVSAGPTTSIREELYEADVIKHYKIRAIIGKGGMGGKTLKALKDVGAVYLAATGGAGALLAESIKGIKSVKFEEFGMPEAMWELEVEDFPAIVAMDSHGRSIYSEVLEASRARLKKL